MQCNVISNLYGKTHSSGQSVACCPRTNIGFEERDAGTIQKEWKRVKREAGIPHGMNKELSYKISPLWKVTVGIIHNV